MKKIIFFYCLILVMVGMSLCVYYYMNSHVEPSIKLNGSNDIELLVGNEYQDEGATAKYKDKDVSSEIKMTSDLDINKIGNYSIKYTINKNDKTKEVTRNIKVFDNIAPVITLNGDATINIYSNDKYDEKGVTIIDNYDGDISSSVAVEGTVDNTKEGTYELTYKTKDSSGNSAEIKRTVIVKNRPTPTVTTTGYVNTGKGGLPVLMYHFFYDDTIGQTGNDANWMAKTAFESQMKYLSDNNFYFPSWQEVEDYIDGKITLPEKSVVVTVDDGDITFLNHAVPIIEKYNVKATSFAVGVWNGDGIYNTYSSSHLNVQSHSYDAHKAGKNGKGLLVNLDLAGVKEDLLKSSQMMGNSTIFCYPFGHYNDTVIQGLKETGYHLAFTTNGGRVYPGQDKYKLPRVRMSRGISLASFAQSVG